MKKVLIALFLPTVIGLCIFLWPRPVQAETVSFASPCDGLVHSLFSLVADSETLRDELCAVNPDIAKAALVESPNCLVCQAAALLTLRGHDDSWADTLGECVDDCELDSAIARILYDSEHEVH